MRVQLQLLLDAARLESLDMATITRTVTDHLTTTVTAATTTAATARAPPQAGILEGANPSVYNPGNPIIIFIIQVSLAAEYGLRVSC